MTEPIARNGVQTFATYLSVMGHPFLTVAASIWAIGALRGRDDGAALPVVALFAAVSVAVLVGIKMGRFNDFDVSERQRRPRFYLVLIAATSALAVWHRDNATAFLPTAVAAATLGVCALVNRWTKASLHTTFSLYAVGLWSAEWPVAAAFGVPLAAAVAWSRVRLQRHTPVEVGVGALIGLVSATSLALPFLRTP